MAGFSPRFYFDFSGLPLPSCSPMRFSRPASRPGARLVGICLLLPSVNVYATQFEVSFEGVFVSEERAASSSFVSSPYKMSLGMRPGSMRLTWPRQRRRLSLSV